MGGITNEYRSSTGPSDLVPTRRKTGALPVFVAVAALIASCAGPSPSTPPVPSTTPYPSTAAPGGSGAPGTPTPTSTPAPVSWARLALPDAPAIANLEPTRAGRGGVAVDTAFKLTSLDGRAPADVAARLVSNPPLTFQVASTDGATAIVRPSAKLRAGTLYRISLARADGSIEAAWAAQTASPLSVTETIPGDSATGVPLTTGIEITFNQTGVTAADLKQHFTIKPAVTGRFEAAGRTIVFVPSTALAKGRVYTVTVTHGLPLTGTGQVLGQDVVVRFETAATASSRVTVSLPRSFLEANPRERAAIGIWIDVPDGAKAPTSIPLTVHRLSGIEAAIDAWKAIEKAPDWTLVSRTAAVPTNGLTRAVKADVRVQGGENLPWIQLPDRLAIGWYIVTETWAGIPRQAVLQVTDVSTFSMLGRGRSAVWVNDLATKKAAVGATAAIDGRRLGVTDDRGLLVATTPSALELGEDAASSPILIVRHGSQSAFQPLSASQYCASCASPTADDEWWQLFTSERSRFRSTDTINAWGVVRNRDTGRVPESVTVTLQPQDWSDDPVAPISTTKATPDANGAFAVRVAIRDLPVGTYRLLLSSGKTQLGELWLEVATIVKPAYRLEMTTDRHALLSGDKVIASVDASFFEGTPVAGTELSLFSDSATGDQKATTDADGHAAGPVAVRLDADDGEQWGVTSVQAIPTLPEEAEIRSASQVAVFRATAIVDTSAALAGTRVSITGKVSDVVFERFESVPPSTLWEVDPRGAARANAAVLVKVVQHTPIRRQTGSRYDFVTKQVEPVYEYDTRVESVSTRTVQTGADGTFRLSVTVKGGTRSYEVQATYTDEGKRQTTGSAGAQGAQLYESRGAWLEAADPDHETGEYSVGDTVRVRFMGGLEDAPVARYFYAIAQRGLTYATAGNAPTFRTTFTNASVPSIRITGVRFNGYGYDLAVSSWRAQLRLSDRALTVKVTPDKARYRPGETAQVAIRTLDPDGKPVSASVFVQVVDEKLYAMGAASQADPLWELYSDVGGGIIAWAASHRTPGDGWEGGDVTGGGGDERSDFRDWLVAAKVTTGADGTAAVTVPLSDDLTSWHVSAAAVDAALEAGSGTGQLAVGLPFFAEATIAPEYLVVDRPVIRVRGFGSGLAAGERVTFTISSDTLLMSGVTATADAFEAAEVPLPTLKAGTHRIRITATVGSGSTLRSDTLTRTFDVVATRATQLMTTWAALDGPVGVTGGSDLTRITLVDAGRGRVVPILQELTWTDGGRSDRVLAAGLANRVLAGAFGLESVTESGGDGLQRFAGEDALAIVPYGSANLEVTALAAMTGDPRLDPVRLAGWLSGALTSETYTRNQRLLALAGLAGLGEPVLVDVRQAAAQTDLTVPEQISVAIAALLAGDEALALSIERDLLSNHGLRQGPWVRIDPGAREDAGVETARLAIVAASLGDPVAADMDAWVAANPPKTTTVALERALAAQGWAKRVAGAPAAAAITVDGTRQQVAIQPGELASIVLTPAQAATARLEPVSGSVLAVTSWVGPLDPASLTPARGQSVTRTVKPAGAIGPTDTVIVTLAVTLGPDARDECWRVTDLAPSGLAPISVQGWWDDEGNRRTIGASPDFVDGQRVEFCVVNNARQAVQTLRYVARVITPGTYRWEGAVLQSSVVPDQGLVIAPVSVTINGTAR